MVETQIRIGQVNTEGALSVHKARWLLLRSSYRAVSSQDTRCLVPAGSVQVVTLLSQYFCCLIVLQSSNSWALSITVLIWCLTVAVVF